MKWIVIWVWLLLVPGLAYGGKPSANLSVYIVPAGASCGTITGQAGQDAAAAGFNTCALYNDFTTTIPNTVGTGLPSNWLDCNQDSSTSSVWYVGAALFESTGIQPCAGHIDQSVDPVNGNQSLRFTMTYGDTPQDVVMTTENWNQTNPVPGPGEYPNAYFEWTWRTDSPNPSGGGQIYNALWSWVNSNAQTLAGNAFGYLTELDFTETGWWSNGDFGSHRWSPGGVNDVILRNTNAGQPTTSYHTWGMLFTGDGAAANFAWCGYIDGVRITCTGAVPYTVANEGLERRYLIMHNTCGNSSGVCINFGSAHMYVKNVKVLTCVKWTQSGAAGMCPGSTLNSTGFYQ